jgi:hypothetical protein
MVIGGDEGRGLGEARHRARSLAKVSRIPDRQPASDDLALSLASTRSAWSSRQVSEVTNVGWTIMPSPSFGSYGPAAGTGGAPAGAQ